MSAAKSKRAAAPGKSARRKSVTVKAPTKRAADTAGSRQAVTVGNEVPEFALASTGGGIWRLSAARGRKLVLYFYPRDNTPGCTLEGQQFSALAARFERAGTGIVGISRDSLAAHEKFRAQMGFP